MVRHKEAIHSGHFMVSNFEAEAQDDEEDIAVPVSEDDVLKRLHILGDVLQYSLMCSRCLKKRRGSTYQLQP